MKAMARRLILRSLRPVSAPWTRMFCMAGVGRARRAAVSSRSSVTAARQQRRLTLRNVDPDLPSRCHHRCCRQAGLDLNQGSKDYESCASTIWAHGVADFRISAAAPRALRELCLHCAGRASPSRLAVTLAIWCKRSSAMPVGSATVLRALLGIGPLLVKAWPPVIPGWLLSSLFPTGDRTHRPVHRPADVPRARRRRCVPRRRTPAGRPVPPPWCPLWKSRARATC